MDNWMIYGATGYTGRLVAQEAVQRGHQPLLAGRSDAKLKSLAQQLDLDYVVAPLDDTEALARAVRRVALVYLAAGPFIHTSGPMLNACVAAGAHYLDITGELQVYQQVFARDAEARASNVALVSGVGFDVVPSDCLAKYVADQLPDATHLITVIQALGSSRGGIGVSAGTAKTELEMIDQSGFVRRQEGRLVKMLPGSGARRFPFPNGDKLAMPVPWGDLETAYRSTGIPNITSYVTLPRAAITGLRLTSGLLPLLKRPSVKSFASRLIDRVLSGPSEKARTEGRTQLYAEVVNASGETRRAWLETLEAYQFTKVAAVHAVERVLAGEMRGALAPSQAFGADFVLEVDGTRRWNALPG